jgi:thiol:disulfide interchange protein
MQTIFAQSALAFAAGMILNFMPCVLPVIPFKVQALLRETTGTTRSRALAAAALLAGSLAFFIVLGAVTAGFGLMWGQQFQHAWFRILLSLFLLAAAIATFAGWSWRLPQLVYRVPMSRHVGAFFTGAWPAFSPPPVRDRFWDRCWLLAPPDHPRKACSSSAPSAPV